MALYPKISDCILSLEEVSAERAQMLLPIEEYLFDLRQNQSAIHLLFVCTHNSRRSMLSQIWSKAIAEHFHIPDFYTYSAGTQSTEVYPTILKVLEGCGFEIEADTSGPQASYHIHYAEGKEPMVLFSKDLRHASLPKQGFAAIMSCDHAQVQCPLVPGAGARFPLTYVDPKIYDGTKAEVEQYTATAHSIASEWYRILNRLKP